MRIVSENGYVDIPYEQAVLVAGEYQLLPFENETSPFDANIDFKVLAHIGKCVYEMAYAKDSLTAKKILERIRRYYCSGEQVVYIADIIEEVTR